MIETAHLFRPLGEERSTLLRNLSSDAFRNVEAEEGTAILLNIDGESGGSWTLRKQASWRLTRGSHPAPVSTVAASALVICRLLLHRLPPSDAVRLVRVEGDAAFTTPLFDARAVMV